MQCQIKVWGSDNNKVDVTEYDGNNQYVKEVKEGEEFNFQITLNDGFEIAQVKVNGNALDPANTEGNVITYKVAGINEEKVIDVTYNKGCRICRYWNYRCWIRFRYICFVLSLLCTFLWIDNI